MFSFDCLIADFDEDDFNKYVYYKKLIFFAILPLLLAAASTILSLIVFGLKNKLHYMTTYYIATLVVIYFYVNQIILERAFSVFNCLEIDGEGYFLQDDLEIECFDNTHYIYMLFVGIPMIIF